MSLTATDLSEIKKIVNEAILPVRQEIFTELSGQRRELFTEMSGQRRELFTEMSGLRHDVKGLIAIEIRPIKNELKALRNDIKEIYDILDTKQPLMAS